MKSPFASAGIATVLAAGLILAPGLSAAQASTLESPASSISATSPSTGELGASSLLGGNVASTYGMFFIPCNIFGLRLC